MRNPKLVLVLKLDSHGENASVGPLCNPWSIQLFSFIIFSLIIVRNRQRGCVLLLFTRWDYQRLDAVKECHCKPDLACRPWTTQPHQAGKTSASLVGVQEHLRSVSREARAELWPLFLTCFWHFSLILEASSLGLKTQMPDVASDRSWPSISIFWS